MQPSQAALQTIREAARNKRRVSGLTHQHYKYPARFSPEFVKAAISAFSKPGDVVLDPYMGGGTTIVEALAAGRNAYGSDLNSLAVFVARVKTEIMGEAEVALIRDWAQNTAQTIGYRDASPAELDEFNSKKTRNLQLPQVRAIKKYLALSLESCATLGNSKAESFARAVLLNVSQWALNGKKKAPTLAEFRNRVAQQTQSMLEASQSLKDVIRNLDMEAQRPTLFHCSAEDLPYQAAFKDGTRADLVVTSPPYPGVHILYHRWQVDGRRETPAPYWIADCLDGHGSAYYNFGDRGQESQEAYFASSLRTLRGIRQVVKDGAIFVQMIAFSNPRHQLARYLKNMEAAGFAELRSDGKKHRRIWRNVPGRNWHAELQGQTNSAREVVLIHRAA